MFLFKPFAQQLNFCYLKFNSSNNNYSAENEEIPTQESSLPSKAVAMKYLTTFEFFLQQKKLEVHILEVSLDYIH